MTFADTPADNMGRIRDWHHQTHPLTKWSACPYMPCAATTETFRKAWDK